MPPHVAPQSRPIADRLFALIFVVVLLVPASATFWYRDADDEDVGSRWRAAMETFGVEADAFREFRAEFEQVFNELFGFRRHFVEANVRATVALFNESPNQRVVIGRDGWFFLAEPGRLDDFRGLRPLKPDELDTWTTALDARRDYLESVGIPYLFVIAPNKQVIYPEYVPERFNRVSATTHTDSLLAALEAKKARTVPLDLKASQLAARREAISYYPHDTHWTPFGAYRGYLAILERLRAHFPAMQPLGPDRIRWEEGAESVFDLGRLIGLRSMPDLEEPVAYYVVKDAAATFPETKPDDLPDLEGLEFAPNGIHSYRVMRSPGDKPRAVLFHDSFSCTVIPLLGEHFSELLTVWEPFDQGLLEEVVEKFRPDVVIEERLDRFLQHMPLYTPTISANRFRKVFESAPDIRFAISGAEGVERFAKRKGLSVDAVEHGTRIHVKNAREGRFDLPRVPVRKGESVVLAMTIWRPTPGISRFQWQSPSRAKDEPMRALEISMPAGESEIVLALPEALEDGEFRLRFRPDAKGEMIVRDAEVRTTTEPGPRIAPPREAPYPEARRRR